MSGQRALPAQDKGRGSLVARDNAGGRKAVQARRGLFKNGRLPSARGAAPYLCGARTRHGVKMATPATLGRMHH